MNLSSLDLNLIVVLDALLEEQNVTRAGARIGLSQPAVSNALGRLRHLLDDPLLERDGRHMRLTRRAHLLKAPLRRILDDLRQTLEEPKPFNPATARFDVRIFASDYTTYILLRELRPRLAERAPGAQLEFTWRERARVSELLEDGEIDFAIGAYDNMPGTIRRAHLYEDRNVVLAHEDHPVFDGELTVERLTSYPRIGVSFDGRNFGRIERALARAGGEVHCEVVLPHALVGPLTVCDTDLLLLTSERMAEQLSRFLPIRWKPAPFALDSVRIELLWHEHSIQDPAKAWFREELTALANAL